MADAPLDRIPILVKEGSIVPMGPVVQSTADAEDPLEIRVYGGKDADFSFTKTVGIAMPTSMAPEQRFTFTGMIAAMRSRLGIAPARSRECQASKHFISCW